MSKTTSANVNTTNILSALSMFDYLPEELDVIRKSSDISGVLLVPKEFYNGCTINGKAIGDGSLNLSTDMESLFSKYIDTINSIKKYISGLEVANELGDVDNDSLSNNNSENSEVNVDTKDEKTSSLSEETSTVEENEKNDSEKKIKDVEEETSKVEEEKATDSKEKLRKVNNQASEVNEAKVTDSEGNIGEIDDETSEVDNSNSNSSDESIDGLDESTSTVVDEAAVSGTGVIAAIDDETNNVSSIEENTDEEEIKKVSEGNDNNKSGITEVSGNKVIKEIVDSDGNVVAVEVETEDGVIWYQVIDNQVVGDTDNKNSKYTLNEVINIIDDGKTITINTGEYDIEQIIYNADGSKESIKINCGDYRLILHFDKNGNIIKVEYIKTQTGVYNINNIDYDIHDMYGNKIGKFNNGKYYIYEVKYDQNGKVAAFRVSPDGEYEKWIVINEYTKESEYSLFTSMQTNEKTNVSLFDNKGLLGLLGVLFIALGVTVAVKVIKKKKNNNEEYSEEIGEYYDDNQIEENLYQDNAIIENKTISTGNYPIYDVKRDENGVIKEARITPMDSEDEYWVEV